MRGKDLTGQRFGRLIALERTDQKDAQGRCYLWRCICDCGTECLAPTSLLTNNLKRSCGCLQRENRQADLTGQRFGRLVALENTGRMDTSVKGHNSYIWKFRCDCGNICEFPIRMLSGGRTSCGCLQRETKQQQAEQMRKRATWEYDTYVNGIRNYKKTSYASNTSGVRGVHWHQATGKWRAVLNFQKKRYELGYYTHLEDAAKARREAEAMTFDEFLAWYSRTHQENE